MILQEEATHVERILSRFEQLAAVWSRLPVGGALAFAWPALEPRIA
ncbi:MAG TPA: hypothetical protein VGC79_26630 [Polyangiaceae bacterium]